MAINLIKKLIRQAEEENGSYAIFNVTGNGIAFTSDAGTRKSTKNFKICESEIIAYEKLLKSLDERCLLFSKLRKIEFTLRDKRSACFKKEYLNDSVIVIDACKVTEIKNKEYKWLVTDADGGSVAFQLKDLKNKKYDVIPAKGGIFDGVFELEEETDLLFCISGEINGIKNSLEKFIKNVIGMGIDTMSLFAVLPNTMDDDCQRNMELICAVKETCNSYYPLFKNTTGTFVCKDKIMMGTNEVTSLFPYEIISKILRGDKYWLIPCEEGSREEYFVMDLGIPKYDREHFLELLFDDFCLDELTKVLEKQNDKWLRKFYIFCAKPILEEKVRRSVYSGLRNIKCIRNTKGKMYYPNEISMADEGDDILRHSVIVKNTLISPSGVDDEYSEMIRILFEKELRIGGYTKKPEIEQLAQDMSIKKQAIDENFVAKLLMLANFDEENPGEIDFSEYSIFPYESTRGLSRIRATDLVIGKPYIKEGTLLYRAVGKPVLWKDLGKIADQNGIETIIAFAQRHGAIGMPQIVKQSAERHSDFSKLLFVAGKQGHRDTNYDYTIPGLDEILKMRSLQLSRLVWNCIISVDKNEAENLLIAEYSSNNRETVNRTDSTLIQILRQRTWVPDKNNKLHMPGNIKIEEIKEDFCYDRRNPILKALQFGNVVKQKEDDLKKLTKLADMAGMKLVNEVEYKEFLQWKKEKDNELKE